jgi:hypothetical protein
MNGRTAQHIVLALLKYKCVQHARTGVLSLHQMTQTKQISCSLRNVLNVILELVNYNEHNHQYIGIMAFIDNPYLYHMVEIYVYIS